MANLKHRTKTALVGAWTGAAWVTGLARLADAVRPPRLTILYGHCVADPGLNGSLHEDMKIEAEHLRSILLALGRRHDLVTVAEGMDRLAEGAGGRSMVALTMDDGYRDNLIRLAPLLQEVGGRATVFLEAGAVVERRLPWLHGLGWLDAKLGAAAAARALAERVPSAAAALAEASDSNRLKRVLKYDADRLERSAALEALVLEHGGDPQAIVDSLYLSHAEARELARVEHIEVGGHTVDHPVLSRLGEPEQRQQIARGRALLAELLEGGSGGVAAGSCGRTFAYPYGRDWDRDAASEAAARAAGYEFAVTTHEGTNFAAAPPLALRRIPIHGGSRLAHLGVTAAGGLRQRTR
ncbi:MAG: polysaccharide deacetylase family protein [Planctomycetota bacterium]|nr:polysaccharide deacetylase family protein [Planctomycetota bacterium]